MLSDPAHAPELSRRDREAAAPPADPALDLKFTARLARPIIDNDLAGNSGGEVGDRRLAGAVLGRLVPNDAAVAFAIWAAQAPGGLH